MARSLFVSLFQAIKIKTNTSEISTPSYNKNIKTTTSFILTTLPRMALPKKSKATFKSIKSHNLASFSLKTKSTKRPSPISTMPQEDYATADKL